LIALPLFRPARDRNATLFLNLENIEAYEDQWTYLSPLGRITPREVSLAAGSAGRVPSWSEVSRLMTPVSTKIRPESADAIRARLGPYVYVAHPIAFRRRPVPDSDVSLFRVAPYLQGFTPRSDESP
jgi:hypothetical protein